MLTGHNALKIHLVCSDSFKMLVLNSSKLLSEFVVLIIYRDFSVILQFSVIKYFFSERPKIISGVSVRVCDCD